MSEQLRQIIIDILLSLETLMAYLHLKRSHFYGSDKVILNHLIFHLVYVICLSHFNFKSFTANILLAKYWNPKPNVFQCWNTFAVIWISSLIQTLTIFSEVSFNSQTVASMNTFLDSMKQFTPKSNSFYLVRFSIFD